MTQQRARDLLAMIKVKEPNELIVNSWWGSFVKDYKEVLQMAIKALEQQPCEDYISREAVLDALHVEGRPTKRFDYVIEVRRDIEALPHVTPKTRMGQWVDDKCSTCGKGIENLIASSEWYRNESPKYCPFCGIKLVEPQESEVKG